MVFVPSTLYFTFKLHCDVYNDKHQEHTDVNHRCYSQFFVACTGEEGMSCNRHDALCPCYLLKLLNYFSEIFCLLAAFLFILPNISIAELTLLTSFILRNLDYLHCPWNSHCTLLYDFTALGLYHPVN